jgi:hypothetical protein
MVIGSTHAPMQPVALRQGRFQVAVALEIEQRQDSGAAPELARASATGGGRFRP